MNALLLDLYVLIVVVLVIYQEMVIFIKLIKMERKSLISNVIFVTTAVNHLLYYLTQSYREHAKI